MSGCEFLLLRGTQEAENLAWAWHAFTFPYAMGAPQAQETAFFQLDARGLNADG
jgi:hypothetical protein